MTVRRDDNVTANLYSDFYQNNLITNTGQNFKDWTAGRNSYVTTWYDQSGNGRHATNGNTGTQPYFSFVSGKYVVFFESARSCVLNMPNITPNSVVCQFWNNNGSYGSIASGLGRDIDIRFGGGANHVNGDNNGNDWYVSSGGSKAAYMNNGSTDVNNFGTSTWNYLALIVQNPNGTPLNGIGMDGYSNSRSINGFMTEIIFHNQLLNANDVSDYYNNRIV